MPAMMLFQTTNVWVLLDASVPVELAFVVCQRGDKTEWLQAVVAFMF